MSASTTSAPAGDLRGLAARGTLVNAAFEVGLTSLALVKGFIVAAFLSRSEYGIWGILVVVLVSLLWLKQVGVGDKYVQQGEADQQLAFQKAFTLELAFTGLFPRDGRRRSRLSRWSTASRRSSPGLVLSLAWPPVALQTPTWVHYRSMRFAPASARSRPSTRWWGSSSRSRSRSPGSATGRWYRGGRGRLGRRAPSRVAGRRTRSRCATTAARCAILRVVLVAAVLAGRRASHVAGARCSSGKRVLGLAAVGASRWPARSPTTPTASTRSSPSTLYPAICAVATAATCCSSRS